MKVTKRTMRIIEMICIALLMIMGALFIASMILELFNAHTASMYCVMCACISGTLAMGTVVIEPA